MDVGKFFQNLESEIRVSLKSDDPKTKAALPHDTANLYRIMHHLEILHSEFAKTPLERNYNHIRNSWKIVARLGEPYHVFERYQGNDVLRNHLLAFLNDGKQGVR